MSRLSSLPPLAAASMQCTACDGSTGHAPVAAFLKEARYAVEVLDVWCAIDVHWTFTITIDGPSELEFSCSLSPNASLVGIEMVAADGYTVRGVVERTAQAAEHFDDAVAAGHTAALVQLDPTAERLKFSVSRVTAPTDVTIVLHLACELSRSVQLHRPATADDGAAIESVRVMLPGSPLASGDAATHPAFPEWLSVNVHSAHSIVRVALDAKSAEGWRESQPATVLEAGTQATAAWERSADVRRHLTPALLIETAPTSPISPLLGTSRGWNAIDCDSEQQAQHLCLVLHRPYLDVTSTSPLYTELVFLVDLSGSMMGTNLDAARAALLACLETLRTFAGRNVLWNLVVFGSKHKRLFTTSRSVDDLEALESGEQYARSMTASMGGTVLLPPLSEICMAPVGEHSRQIFIITDGQVENEHEIIRFVRQQSAVRIFAYGIGNGVSSTLVRALGRQGVGSDSALLPSSLLAHSANGSELQSLVRNQLLEAMTPALLRLSISFTDAGHDETLACDDITPSPLTPLYAGSCSVVYARVAKGTIATSPSAKVRGYDAQRGEWVEFAVPISHRVPTTAHQLGRLVGTLAAARRIRQLEELAFEDGSQLAGEEIERLGVRYQLATSRTSFVAIEERVQQAATGALELVRAGMPVARPPQPPPSARAPVCLTSAVNWRVESLRYKRNEYFLDIAELQSVIMLARDASLVCHSLKGSIKAKCMLSGMPEVRIHFNEPLQHLFRVGYARFHQAVLSNRLDTGVMNLIPPDGDSELAQYHVPDLEQLPNAPTPPFELRYYPSTETSSDASGTIRQFSVTFATTKAVRVTSIQVKIPVPETTIGLRCRTDVGTARYARELNAVLWSLPGCTDEQPLAPAAWILHVQLRLECETLPQPDRRPMLARFKLEDYCASGIELSGVRILERSNYKSELWYHKCTNVEVEARL